jgi:hypothetical protein
MKRPLLALGLFVSVGIAAGCLDDSITGTRPLTFTLTANTTTAVAGDSITFTFDATGTSLFGVVLSYGDGMADTVLAQTPNIVEWTEEMRYAYTTEGSFRVVGRVESAAGNRADTVDVVITAPAGS